MILSGTVLGRESEWRVRRWSFKLKVNLMVNLRVSLRVCLREELRVVPSGMVRGRSHCRKQWVNLADLVIISRLGDHSLLNMVKDQYQQPTEVDMVDEKYQISLQENQYFLVLHDILMVNRWNHHQGSREERIDIVRFFSALR